MKGSIRTRSDSHVIFVSQHQPINFDKLADKEELSKIILVSRNTRRQKRRMELQESSSSRQDQTSLCPRRVTSAAA